jgi:hypothetical protein
MSNDIIYDDLSIQMHSKIKERNQQKENEKLEKQKSFEKMCDLAHQNMMDVLTNPEFLHGGQYKPFKHIFNDFYEFKQCKSFVDFKTAMEKRDIGITQTNNYVNYTKLNDVYMKFEPDSGFIKFGY